MEEFDVWTLGFSNRTWEDTEDILHTFGIEVLADVRTAPGSRRYPQFNKASLEEALPKIGMEYVPMPILGGFRKGPLTELNAGWRNASFRHYADYMQTPEFDQGIEELVERLQRNRTVYVCTEAVFWRCHRALISDALEARGVRVGHIFSATKAERHRITPFAQVEGLRITYPQA